MKLPKGLLIQAKKEVKITTPLKKGPRISKFLIDTHVISSITQYQEPARESGIDRVEDAKDGVDAAEKRELFANGAFSNNGRNVFYCTYL